MPTINYRCTLLYGDDVSNLTWSLTNVFPAPDPATLLLQADMFNSAYMGCLPDSVSLLDFFVEILDTPGAYYHSQPSVFTDKVGLIMGGTATEIASYAMYRGFGGPGFEGSAFWKLHGIDESFVSGSKLLIGTPTLDALLLACGDWLLQFRAVATAIPPAGRGYPVVDPPHVWLTDDLSGMYNKRLGRPRYSPGQQHRYSRSGA